MGVRYKDLMIRFSKVKLYLGTPISVSFTVTDMLLLLTRIKGSISSSLSHTQGVLTHTGTVQCVRMPI